MRVRGRDCPFPIFFSVFLRVPPCPLRSCLPFRAPAPGGRGSSPLGSGSSPPHSALRGLDSHRRGCRGTSPGIRFFPRGIQPPPAGTDSSALHAHSVTLGMHPARSGAHPAIRGMQPPSRGTRRRGRTGLRGRSQRFRSPCPGRGGKFQRAKGQRAKARAPRPGCLLWRCGPLRLGPFPPPCPPCPRGAPPDFTCRAQRRRTRGTGPRGAGRSGRRSTRGTSAASCGARQRSRGPTR